MPEQRHQNERKKINAMLRSGLLMLTKDASRKDIVLNAQRLLIMTVKEAMQGVAEDKKSELAPKLLVCDLFVHAVLDMLAHPNPIMDNDTLFRAQVEQLIHDACNGLPR